MIPLGLRQRIRQPPSPSPTSPAKVRFSQGVNPLAIVRSDKTGTWQVGWHSTRRSLNNGTNGLSSDPPRRTAVHVCSSAPLCYRASRLIKPSKTSPTVAKPPKASAKSKATSTRCFMSACRFQGPQFSARCPQRSALSSRWQMAWGTSLGLGAVYRFP